VGDIAAIPYAKKQLTTSPVFLGEHPVKLKKVNKIVLMRSKTQFFCNYLFIYLTSKKIVNSLD
jgi:hypothetical protein